MNGNTGLLIAVGLLIVIAIAVFVGKRQRPTEGLSRWPLYAKRVLGEREQVLYWRLVAAFPDRVVLAQVALSQVLGIEKGAKQRQVLFNRFRQLTADFVVCRRSFEPVAVIELDGLSHDRPHRQAADQRKTLAVESAGLVLVRINAAALPDEVELRRLLPDTRGDGQPRNRNA